MKKIFAAAVAAVMVCGLCLPAFAGCKSPSLYATFEAPELPAGVVDLQFHTYSRMEEDGTIYYDLLSFSYGTQNEVYLDICVEPGYRVKEVTLLIEAEDGSWTQIMTELEEGYSFIDEYSLPNEEIVECVRYRTKTMPSFKGKSGKAKVRVPVLELERAEYNLRIEKIWDDSGNPAPDTEAIGSLLDTLKFEVTAKNKKRTYTSWAEFEENVLGKDDLYGFDETFKVKIHYPEGTNLDDISGYPGLIVLYIEAGENYGGEIFDGSWRSCKQLSDYVPEGDESDPDVRMMKNDFVTFAYNLRDYTAQWEFKIERGSKICFNEYDLYFILTYYSLPYIH